MLDFSIIVPTYQRPAELSACLKALSGVHYDRSRWEVIVVDDGSSAPPEDLVSAFKGEMDVHMVSRPHAGPAAARNAGAAQARGRYLVFTDDDCRPAPGWLSAFAQQFAGIGECVLGGRTINAVSGNIYSIASQMLLDYVFKHFNAEPANAQILISNNLAIPANVFRAAGGFDERFPIAAAEDRELCDRLKHMGYRLIYYPDAVVMHHHVLSLGRFWRQHYNYGVGAYRFHQTRATRSNNKLRVEPPGYYWNLLRYPMVAAGKQTTALTALLAISQVANAAGFFRQKLAHAFQLKES